MTRPAQPSAHQHTVIPTRPLDARHARCGCSTSTATVLELGWQESRRWDRTVAWTLDESDVALADVPAGPGVFASALDQGRTGGRPPRLTPEQAEQAQQLYDSNTPVPKIARTLKAAPATIYRYITPKAAN
ncbi:helix-turn-helix domain-containing protein [Streptomyces sp. NPDC004838]